MNAATQRPQRAPSDARMRHTTPLRQRQKQPRASSDARIRAFVAIEISDDAKRALAALIQSLRERRIDGLRLVRPEGMHLTLKFLGNIDASRVPRIADALAAVSTRHAPFHLTLTAPGFFPNADRARVLWIGVDGDLGPLRGLQRDVDETLATLDFAAEKRPFNPHLTIARMRDSAARASRRRAADAIAAYPLPHCIVISANAVSLMQSDLRPGGAVYIRIAHAPLISTPQMRAES